MEELNLELGQIFWLIIPLLNKSSKYIRPFLVYEINGEDYIFLKISSTPKDHIPQFPLIKRPSSFYREKSFVELNIFVFIKKHKTFSHILNKTTRPIEQGQHILEEDFSKIVEEVNSCFKSNDEKYWGNRYKIRVE